MTNTTGAPGCARRHSSSARADLRRLKSPTVTSIRRFSTPLQVVQGGVFAEIRDHQCALRHALERLLPEPRGISPGAQRRNRSRRQIAEIPFLPYPQPLPSIGPGRHGRGALGRECDEENDGDGGRNPRERPETPNARDPLADPLTPSPAISASNRVPGIRRMPRNSPRPTAAPYRSTTVRTIAPANAPAPKCRNGEPGARDHQRQREGSELEQEQRRQRVEQTAPEHPRLERGDRWSAIPVHARTSHATRSHRQSNSGIGWPSGLMTESVSVSVLYSAGLACRPAQVEVGRIRSRMRPPVRSAGRERADGCGTSATRAALPGSDQNPTRDGRW